MKWISYRTSHASVVVVTMNNKGSAIPLVLGVFVFFSLLNFITFNAVYMLTLAANQEVDVLVLDERHMVEIDAPNELLEFIRLDPTQLRNIAFIEEEFNVVTTSPRFDEFIFTHNDYVLEIKVLTDFPSQGQGPPTLPPPFNYLEIIFYEIRR